MVPSRFWCTFLLLVWIVECQAISKCLQKDVCSCESEDGLLDLRPLDGPADSPTFTNITDPSGNYVYSYNPCTPFDTQHGCHLAAVCQVGPSGTRDSLIGIHSTATFHVSGSEVNVTYADTASSPIRTSEIRLKCDPKVEKSLVFNGENPPNHYYFTLTTKYACFQKVPHKLPHNVTTEVPSNVTTEMPHNVTTEVPSNVTTEMPHNVTTEVPSNVTTKMPHNVTTEGPFTVTTFAPSPPSCQCDCGQWLTAVILLCVIIMLFLAFLITVVVLRLGVGVCRPTPKKNIQNAEGTGEDDSVPYSRIM